MFAEVLKSNFKNLPVYVMFMFHVIVLLVLYAYKTEDVGTK